MKRIFTITALILFGICFASCKKDNPIPPEDQPQVNLTLEDASCTEAWLKLTAANIGLPAEAALLQNDAVIQTISLSTTDTLLYIDSLLPNHTYKFQSVIQSVNKESDAVNLTTMDTTSHNFTFETFTFGGQAGSCNLYDAAIIDENDIWAVGEIYVADTSQNGYTLYNAVHWNGNQWELKRILFNGNYWVIRTIFAFSENDIWFSTFVKYDGQNFISLPIPGILMGWSPNKIWGTSSNDLYVVGNSGNIAHYQNGQWSRIESGTDVDLKDIYGSLDGKELWTCGWSNQNGRVTIIKIKDNGVESIWESQTNREFSYYYGGQLLNTLWANGNEEFVFATGVVTRHSLLNKKLVRFDWVPFLNGVKVLDLGNYAYRIRGSNKNNISIIGDEAMIWHYNGVTWHKFEELQNVDDRLYGLAVTENLIVTVGIGYGNGLGEALILIGRR